MGFCGELSYHLHTVMTKRYLDLTTLQLPINTNASDGNKQRLLYNRLMTILGLMIILLFVAIIVMVKNNLFLGKADIRRQLFKALTAKKSNILKSKLCISIGISIFVFLTLRTSIFGNFQLYRDLGFSPDKQVISTEKEINSNDEAAYFFWGILTGYAFDTWVAALAIGCLKEICDLAGHYHSHTISGPQIIHDGIMDPLFWALGGFAGSLSLGKFRTLLGKPKRKKDTNKLPQIATAMDSSFVFDGNSYRPLVSVVVPALNEEGFIQRTLFSLINQDFKDYELIVVDNNSQDKTAQIAEQFGARVIFEPRKGIGYSREAGFRAATGSIIATTDADTVLPHDWLSRILKEFSSDQKLVAFGGLYSLYNGPFLARFAVRYMMFFVWAFDRIFSGGWTLPGVNLAVRREAYLRIGGFNTKLDLGEDGDLSQRLKYLGKVKLDMGFRVQTSGRRYRNGLFMALVQYLPNALARIFLGNPERFSRFSQVREEKFISDKYWLLWLATCISFLLIIAPLKSPRLEARVVKPIKERAEILERAISVREKSLIERLKIRKHPMSSSKEHKFVTYEA